MKHLCFILFSFGLFLPLQGQDLLFKYWVWLRDKEGTAYSLDRPEEFLSLRALERRQSQGIAIDSLDLPLSDTYLTALRRAGFYVQNRSKWLNGVVLFAGSESLAVALDTLPFVQGYQLYDTGSLYAPEVEVEGYGMEMGELTFDSPYTPPYYNLAYDPIAQLGGLPLHQAGYHGEGLLIGVCDGGFPGVDHLDFFDSLRSEGRLLATRDFVWAGDQVFSVHQHGTLVLSSMAALLPGIYVGTAPKASYVLCRTENTLSESPLEEYNWVSAVEYLDSLGADIITSSLGYFFFDNPAFDHTLQQLDGRTADMSRAADIAVSRGMLLLNSIGNEGEDILPHINIPADVERVLTVGACDRDGNLCGFSSYGPTADDRIKPDLLALGENVFCAAPAGGITIASGTSLSCPILAGMMACLWQRYPGLTPDQLCDSVRSWGNRADNPDSYVGYGIPNFGNAMPSSQVEIKPAIDAPSFSLYPNPATTAVTCTITQAGILTLFDALGRELVSRPVGSGSQALSLTTLPRGFYWLRLSTPTATITRKLLLN